MNLEMSNQKTKYSLSPLPNTLFDNMTTCFQIDNLPSISTKESFHPSSQRFQENPLVHHKDLVSQKRVYADRFIPIRTNDPSTQFKIDNDDDPGFSCTQAEFVKDKHGMRYKALLEEQLFGSPDVQSNVDHFCLSSDHSLSGKSKSRLLKFHQQNKIKHPNIDFHHPLDFDILNTDDDKFCIPISDKPYRTLEAPELEDDYYLNLLDWSNGNMLAVALKNSIYLWSGVNSSVSQLTNIPNSLYSTLSWNMTGEILTTGTSDGKIEIWDVNKSKRIRPDISVHEGRIGSCSWISSNVFATGSRDKTIVVSDIRAPNPVYTFVGHTQEVCGLKWSPSGSHIASGGNDNKLMIWNFLERKLEAKFSSHTAAVKALTWSPHQSGLLISGGGTNDKTIKFWNIHTHQEINSIFAGSQVCNLVFSKNSNEFVSTHGFSKNQIIVWKYPDLSKVSILEGHSSRVLFLALSPDGEDIVTGAGDESLRFWKVFPPKKEEIQSEMKMSAADLR